MENDDRSKGGGRPPVGPQVSFAIPQEILDQADAEAAQHRVRRADVLRDYVTRGAAQSTAAGPENPLLEMARPVAEILASWIAQPDDAEERRDRFKTMVAASDRPDRYLPMVQRAVGELVLSGGAGPDLAADLGTIMEVVEPASQRAGWRLRGQIYHSTMARLLESGVSVATGEPSSADDIPLTPADDDYA